MNRKTIGKILMEGYTEKCRWKNIYGIIYKKENIKSYT